MAVTDTARMGMRHLTVVPRNFRRDDDEEDADLECEPRVPRHR